jgi:hypothetical protein
MSAASNFSERLRDGERGRLSSRGNATHYVFEHFDRAIGTGDCV